jgi:S1-C subfamily serine protease
MRGDSGSPVFDLKGRLVGLLARLDDDNPEIGFIVPIAKARTMVPDLGSSGDCG